MDEKERARLEEMVEEAVENKLEEMFVPNNTEDPGAQIARVLNVLLPYMEHLGQIALNTTFICDRLDTLSQAVDGNTRMLGVMSYPCSGFVGAVHTHRPAQIAQEADDEKDYA